MADKKLTPIAFVKLKIDGKENAGLFMNASFPGGTIPHDETHVYDQQGGNERLRTPGGTIQWSDITLTRGLDKDKGLYDIFEQAKNEGPEAVCKEYTIEACDHKKNTIMSWTLTDAWVCGYQPGQSTAGASQTLTEQITITYGDAKRTV